MGRPSRAYIAQLAAIAILPCVYGFAILPTPVIERHAFPLTTPAPIYEPSYERRDIISQVSDGVASAAGGIGGVIDSISDDISSLGSKGASLVKGALSTEVNFGAGYPTGTAVQKSLSLDDGQVKALPTQVLNIPSYANWTDQGWNLRFRANVYKQPNISESTLDDLANKFLIGTKVKDLPAEQQKNARNLTAAIFVLQQGDVKAKFHLEPAPSQGSSGQKGGGGGTTPSGGSQDIDYPEPTTPEGDIDGFVSIKSDNLDSGNKTAKIQRLNVYAEGASLGNATSFLVPETGFTVVSDIDDILRVTKIWDPKEGLFNSFAKDFTPWLNMPDIYANWSKSIPNMHFHYLTTTPEQVTRNYMDFIYKNYPGGSFDTRPLNFSDASATLSIREYLLDKIFESYPKRKFVLVADTSNSDVMRDYPKMATQYPGQVQCILLRNTSETDSSDYFPYNTKGFKGLNTDSYFFFNVPDDLKHLDLTGGKCVNSTIPQHVEFKYQNLPFDSGSFAVTAQAKIGTISWALFGLAVWLML